ncbi:MAG: hypothetical protein R3C01_04505, partial [Planctomycetaceae bacterium]
MPSLEGRSAVVYVTMIIIPVFLPVFVLEGLPGVRNFGSHIGGAEVADEVDVIRVIPSRISLIQNQRAHLELL